MDMGEAAQIEERTAINLLLNPQLEHPHMNRTIVTSAAAGFLAAAVPASWLWHHNTSLRGEMDSLRRTVAVLEAAPPPPPAKIVSDKTGAAPSEITDASPASAPGSGEPAQEQTQEEKLAALFTGPGFLETIKSEAKKEVEREVSRLGLRLNLSEEQRAKVQEFLTARQGPALRAFQAVFASGLLNRSLDDPASLTPEDKAALARLDPEKNPETSLDGILPGLLSADQLAEYQTAKEERRVSLAEENAAKALSSVKKMVDLSAEQQDALFQAVAQGQLAPADNLGGPPPEWLAWADPSRDAALREILSPEQFALYEPQRAAEVKMATLITKKIFEAISQLPPEN